MSDAIEIKAIVGNKTTISDCPVTDPASTVKVR